MSTQFNSYVKENIAVLQKIRYLPMQKRDFLILTSGKNLTLALSELLTNLVKNSNKSNLQDKKTIKLIGENFHDLGEVMNPRTSIKVKKNILINNKTLQKLALNIALDGFLYFISKKEQMEKR